MRLIPTILAALVAATPAMAELKVALQAPWDGKRVPAGQHCTLQGGKGSTPPMQVSGLPQGTKWVYLYFNDKSYQPLSTKGGHGVIAVPAKAGAVSIPALPGMTARLPGGAMVVSKARATGQFASDGYLPPCSNGRNNLYAVDVVAVSADGKVLDRKANVSIGRY